MTHPHIGQVFSLMALACALGLPACVMLPPIPTKTSSGTTLAANTTSAHGRYQQLRQVMHCPQDRGSYGQYHDYGYWAGGAWCGQTGQAGYWVWSAPDWYIWNDKIRQPPMMAATQP
jgi:hypothetical protein